MTVEMNSELQQSATIDNTLFTLTKEQLTLLGKQHELLLIGSNTSFSWEEAQAIIRGN